MAIGQVNVIATVAAAASADSYAFPSTDTTGASGAYLIFSHDGAPTTYTWSDNKSTPGANFVTVATVDNASGGLSTTLVFVHGFTGGTDHVFTVTLGAARSLRFGGGVTLSGTFTSGFSAATAVTGSNSTHAGGLLDIGSLVTDRAAYAIHLIADSGDGQMDGGSGWTVLSNGVAGLTFQARNEAGATTLDPATNNNFMFDWNSIAHAAGEGDASGNATPAPTGVEGAIAVGSLLTLPAPPPPYTLTRVTG